MKILNRAKSIYRKNGLNNYKKGDIMAEKKCLNNILDHIKKCSICGSELKPSSEYMIRGNKGIEVKAKECIKCGEFFLENKEYEKARKILYPNFLIKLKDSMCNLIYSDKLFIFGRRIL